MAIQKINLGTEPLGEGGDTYRSANTKINENFSNTTHAASRLVGANATDLVENKSARKAVYTNIDGYLSTPELSNFDLFEKGKFYLASAAGNNGPKGLGGYVSVLTIDNYATSTALQMSYGYAIPGMSLRIKSADFWSPWVNFYHSGNTTKDSNGMIKASSPVLRVFNDRIEGNDDGERMGAKFVKKGVGDYIIKGTTGLAEEGWYVTVPQDANGNNLVAVEYERLGNGDVALRTYKRRFDFETVSIVADHDNPLDIPETRWIDLRFNELEQEQLNEPVTKPESK